METQFAVNETESALLDNSNMVSHVSRALLKPDCWANAKDIFHKQLSRAERDIYLKLDEQVLQDYLEIFNIFDVENDASIPNGEIPKLMLALGESPPKEEME